ncbi:hypothetical protein [Kingella oralis]
MVGGFDGVAMGGILSCEQRQPETDDGVSGYLWSVGGSPTFC